MCMACVCSARTEQQHAMHERVVVSERDIRECLAAGRVLACATTLRAATDTATSTLSHVHALNTTRLHLEGKKRELVDVILRRLSAAVYGETAPLSRRVSARRRTALLLAELTKSEEVTDAYLQDITPEFEASLSEEDKTFETTVMISLEALGVLDQLKEATEELKQAYEREAEILGSSLGDGAVSRREIVGDINALGDLALLCESMDWLATNIRSLPSILTAPSPGGSVKLTDRLREDIASAAMIFEEISHKCLLFLHLERSASIVMTNGKKKGRCESSASTSWASRRRRAARRRRRGAGRLAHALLAFHEHAQACMAPNRRAYIFNGIGEMMSAGVVWRWQCADSDALFAGATLATLRHCLAALALPHAGLQRAHDYSGLLTALPEPEEIVASIREKGAKFSELEYLNAFKVIAARRGLSQADMKVHLKALASALGHVGVTV
ncbi:hypothetical protein MSG28_007471 [Choristoneura fumiferana]|uniref:Uncharacterized protein n=1 Tax=Choristoneura fumiferana TaxID=7141 RepID=A0ACC0JXJ5_CHOFU|nr:hypothetical protein MSG28_007471 [Choristoneura fumiferana]